jgi:hypothetical protein
VLITIYFEKIQINIETIYSHFRNFGNIQKIIIFRKKNFQIFIELASTNEALRFKNILQSQNFDHLFNLKIQFTQKKELVVNNNTMMEYDFTKSDSESYSDFRNNSYSDLQNNTFSDKQNKMFFQGHPSQSLMTPESINKIMYLQEFESNERSRFMTPKGSNINGLIRENCPSSARLDLKMTNPRHFNPYSGKLNGDMYSMGIFTNIMDPRSFRMNRDQEKSKKGLSPLGDIQWFESGQNSPNVDKLSTQKTFLETRVKEIPKKTLSLKEKYKRKIMANKRKKKLKEQEDSKDTVAPLSTESKATLERQRKESREHHEKTEKKEKQLEVKDKQEKTTAKKKSVIINPNIVVNNFSFKGEQKVVENNSFFQNKIKEHEPSKTQAQKDSNFSLTNLKENLSHESIEEGKLNIFRVFDHENSSEKTSILSENAETSEKHIGQFLDIKNNCQSGNTSRDSFKEFNFKMSSEENNGDLETDVMDTHHGGFGYSRQYYEDTLSEAALKRLSQSNSNFEELQDPLIQNPLDTLKNSFSRPNSLSKSANLGTPQEFLTFHSKFFDFLTQRIGSCFTGIQYPKNSTK